MEDRLFRDAMGKFATGVTVVTTQYENESFGMTANAFMSVSLDPKLVVVSIGHKARFLSKVQESKKFAVNILAADQKDFSMVFAGQLKDEITINFEELAVLPVLPGALAQVSCEVVAEHVEGDHTLFIGKVLDIKVNDGEPLVFYAGKYRELVESEVKNSLKKGEIGMNIIAAANALLEAEQTKIPISPFTSQDEQISVEDAYGIQLQMIKSKLDQGATVEGMKIGLTSKAMQEMLNVYTPDYGHILNTMVYEENQPVDPTQFIQPRVEFEIAFVLKEDLKGPEMVEDVYKATDYVVPAIEIIDSRIKDWKIKFEDTVADNGSSAGAILGDNKTPIDEVDLAAVEMKAYKNNELFDTATGAAVLGNPAKAVAWLANELANYDIALQKGQFILAGALSKAVDVVDGEEYAADFGPLGKVAVSFVKAGVMK